MARIDPKEGLKLAGGFVLGRLLGRGAGTEVWTARRPDGPEGEVAVKVLRDKGRYAALCAQAVAMGRLFGTERTARLVAAHLYDDPTFIAIEPVLDASLADRLVAHGGPLGAWAALSILRDVLRGLGEAHDRGVPHGGLRESNVLLDVRDRAFVTDFGGAIAGAMGVRPGLGADLAAAGRLLFRTVTGAEPSAGERPSGRIPGLPAPIDGAVERCLAAADSEDPAGARAAILRDVEAALEAAAPQRA